MPAEQALPQDERVLRPDRDDEPEAHRQTGGKDRDQRYSSIH
ncbi:MULTISPECIES: hypothetical protein [Spiribacter]|nr:MULTISPECIES: hypothetical protein [Spiribacter]